jgi:uncharacterized protein YjbJ (UPF0337 family)
MKIHPILAVALFASTLAACGKHSSDGSTQQATGHIEAAAGDLTGSSKLKHEGKKDEVEGGVKNVVGDVKDTVHDATKSR